MSHTPHDALFKAVFSNPARAMDEIRAVLAPEAGRHLDFASAELVPGNFVDEALKERQTDLLFCLKVHGREAFAYLLFEHQSEPDALMTFRLLRYMVRIWERWLTEHPGAPRLPAIVPLVLSHSQRGWTAPRRLCALYDLEPGALADLAQWLPDFETPVDDLWAHSDDALRTRAMDALAKLVVLSLKHSRTPEDVVGLFETWGELIRLVIEAPSGVAALRLVVGYLLEVRQVDTERLGRVLERVAGPKAKEAIVTTAEQLLEEGRQEGRQEGSQRTLLRLLERRFGELAPPLVARVQAATLDQLDVWSDRVLTAPSLDEIFAS